MSRPYQNQDSGAYLRKAAALRQPRSAFVIYRGRRVARLFEDPDKDLKLRAEHFIKAIGYRDAEIRFGRDLPPATGERV